jgi:hypothetical protein
VPLMKGTLSLLLAVLLCACGRTELVDGYQLSPPVREAPQADAGVELIEAGECVGPSRVCPRGFHCESGRCVLNGGQAELQVTLQWKNDPRTPDDLDLHLIEPFPVQGSCEIYFGSGGLFSCSAMGRLDLDANGACVDTAPGGGAGADTENIIYPPDKAVPRGHYIVRVDYWSECGGGVDVPFVVTVRNGPTITRRTGVFHPGESDSGQEGSGVTLLEFDVP